MTISGKTKLFPIIGAPIDTVFSPPAMNAWFRANNVDAVMVPLHVPCGAEGLFFSLLRQSKNMLGCSVTFPHKQAAFGVVDHPSTTARALSAVNTIRRNPDGSLSGEMTDGVAMLRAIRNTGYPVDGACACVVGAGGGSGAAICLAMAEAGARQIALMETNVPRLERIKACLTKLFPNTDLTSEPAAQTDIYVNATTLGKAEADPLPFDGIDFQAGGLYCDVVTRDGPTPQLQHAASKGLSVVSGEDMGAGQVDAQMAFLLGQCPG